MSEREIVIQHGAWNIRHTPNGQYADIYYGGSTAVDCINYIHGDGTRTYPTKKQLKSDLVEWVEEQGDLYIEAVINYI